MWFVMTLYVALPAFVANMMPVVAARWRWLPGLATPIHEGLFGAHKTWRGVVVAIVAGTLVATVQALFAERSGAMLFLMVLFGALSGLGAMVGDAVKSIFKRKLGIAPGAPFIPFDHIDYIIGMLIFTYPVYAWPWQQALFLLVFVSLANPLVNVIGYTLGIKKTYW